VQTRRLIHPYSDLPDCAADIRVVALEEALADKLKCLLQRRSSFDLFDLVYSIFVNNDIAVDRLAVVATFLKKTIFQASPSAALNLLLGVPFDVTRRYWNTKIVCAKDSPLDSYNAASCVEAHAPLTVVARPAILFSQASVEGSVTVAQSPRS
jgi:hypothetical protein